MAPPTAGALWRWTTGTWTRRLCSTAVVAALLVGVVVFAADDAGRATSGARTTTATTTTSSGRVTTEATSTTMAERATIDVATPSDAARDTTVPPDTSDPSGAATPTTGPPVVGPPQPVLPPLPEGGLRFLPEDTPDNGSRAPLTGLPVPDPTVLGRPALAVKIDNLDTARETARPQTGLAFADVVVEEVVEGGITRFVAVLHSTDAPEVGPVRSARTTDVHLLPVLGRPLFAYSGGNPGVLAAVAAASSIEDRGGEWAPAYARDHSRRAPHNLYLRPWEVWARSGGATTPPPLAAFRPRGQGSPVGAPVAGVTLGFGGVAGAPASWRWLAEEGRWLRQQRGTVHLDGSGYAVGPRNVVLMFTDYVDSPVDTRSPEAVTIGGGEAWVLTDGRLIRGRWQRDALEAPLTFLDATGAPISLSAGRTWIELVRPEMVGVVA